MVWILIALIAVLALVILVLSAGGRPRQGTMLATVREWGLLDLPELLIIAVVLGMVIAAAVTR